MNKETGYPEFIIDEEFNPEYLYHYAKYSITPYKINYDKARNESLLYPYMFYH